jgi:hypothetical protein
MPPFPSLPFQSKPPTQKAHPRNDSIPTTHSHTLFLASKPPPPLNKIAQCIFPKLCKFTNSKYFPRLPTNSACVPDSHTLPASNT